MEYKEQQQRIDTALIEENPALQKALKSLNKANKRIARSPESFRLKSNSYSMRTLHRAKSRTDKLDSQIEKVESSNLYRLSAP